MTFTLRCPRCDAPVHIIDDNGVVDPKKTRWEEYEPKKTRWEEFECEHGHVFSRTLEPRR